ncbi:MAG: cysteine--tRNA ligase [Patescibacteria group bacterium]
MNKLQLYNTLTRKKEPFELLNPKTATIYSCGPTVYAAPHIGNLRNFLFVDFLRRWLEFLGYNLIHVMNLTDVDDKTIRRSREENITLGQLTDREAKNFFADLKKLNIKPAHHYPRATQHIPEMVILINQLIAKNFAYEKDGSIYFRVSAFPGYGRLSGVTVDNIQLGARIDVDEYEKESAQDFVLWKAWKENDGDVFWEPSFNGIGIIKGRPGWHIECSAMSMKYLGATLDIHTGGVDLIFPHHENEIAQSEAATEQTFVRFWLHCEHLMVESAKMAKSSGNTFTLTEIAPDELSAAAFRLLIFGSDYQKKFNFTQTGLKSAKKKVLQLRAWYENLCGVANEGEADEQVVEAAAIARAGFIQQMNDNLNTPRALAVLYELMNKLNSPAKKETFTKASAKIALDFLNEVDQLLGIINVTKGDDQTKLELTDEQQSLVTEREQARRDKNWLRSDEIRNRLAATGIGLIDNQNNTTTAFSLSS